MRVIFGIDGQLGGGRRPGIVDPKLRGDEFESEADPEGGAEKLAGLGVAAAKHGGGEERAHNRANGGYGEASSVTANHPFAVLREFAVHRMPKSP